jgi:hypothetical protein
MLVIQSIPKVAGAGINNRGDVLLACSNAFCSAILGLHCLIGAKQAEQEQTLNSTH